MLGEMTEVFKTTVQKPAESEWLIRMLLSHFPNTRINFDLEDCDRILRVEGQGFCTERIASLVTEAGFSCELL